MKILFATDGSKSSWKALAYLIAHPELAGDDELLVLHVQAPIPAGVGPLVGPDVVDKYHQEEGEAVLLPIENLLKHHGVAASCRWVVGTLPEALLNAARTEHAKMIVMGTHGHGAVGRFFMGGVSQAVVTHSDVPVLLVK